MPTHDKDSLLGRITRLEKKVRALEERQNPEKHNYIGNVKKKEGLKHDPERTDARDGRSYP